ncbi:alpha/beta hydrolase [Erythrobacter colymbi]|uniref:alpha/beta hydrolase n=1 Tax=Erythrobacter colymbi TaxID=1161202 RepID=UPI00197F02DC
MNRALALLLAAFALLLPHAAALAQVQAASGSRVVSTVSWVEEWDPASGQWVRVEDAAESIAPAAYTTTTTATSVARAGAFTVTETVSEPQPVRFISQPARIAAQSAGIAAFGPFRVIDDKHAALVAATDAGSPQAFAAMLAQFPGLEVIEFVDAPGTTHDLANLRLGRAIRAAGLATHVPAGGSARSGAVELFLAGTRRSVDPGALFAVHSWRDERGREPADFAPDAPENRLYLDYYTEMGMTADQARDFYAMTNSVPHAGALWLEGAEMTRWIEPASRAIDTDMRAALRLALARSGTALAGALGKPWRLPRLALPTFAPEAAPAPRLAYAEVGSGWADGVVLDSRAAFP